MFTESGLQDAAPGYEKKRIIDALNNHHWLSEKDSGRQNKKTRTVSGFKYLYYVFIPGSSEN